MCEGKEAFGEEYQRDACGGGCLGGRVSAGYVCEGKEAFGEEYQRDACGGGEGFWGKRRKKLKQRQKKGG
ncbi:hypothetical protein BhenCHDE101_07375 [Bartonella henselae]|nr:hypothetical protein BhenCHDE101_07375 [Bartonella henselae]PNM38976.1 hypothetical protein AL470_006690 [Bartonella henselae str. Houston-1]